MDQILKVQQKITSGVGTASLQIRWTEPYKAITKPQDQQCPPEDKMDYDVQMVAIQAPGSENGQSNFDFANEAGDKVFKTTLKPSIALSEKSLRGMDIRKIIVWYQQSDAFMLSLQFFDAQGKQLLETGWKENSRK